MRQALTPQRTLLPSLGTKSTVFRHLPLPCLFMTFHSEPHRRWQNGLLNGWTGWTAKPASPQCHLPTQLKDVSISTIPDALSTLEALWDYVLGQYKSTFTLHYVNDFSCWTRRNLILLLRWCVLNFMPIMSIMPICIINFIFILYSRFDNKCRK